MTGKTCLHSSSRGTTVMGLHTNTSCFTVTHVNGSNRPPPPHASTERDTQGTCLICAEAPTVTAISCVRTPPHQHSQKFPCFPLADRYRLPCSALTSVHLSGWDRSSTQRWQHHVLQTYPLVSPAHVPRGRFSGEPRRRGWQRAPLPPCHSHALALILKAPAYGNGCLTCSGWHETMAQIDWVLVSSRADSSSCVWVHSCRTFRRSFAKCLTGRPRRGCRRATGKAEILPVVEDACLPLLPMDPCTEISRDEKNHESWRENESWRLSYQCCLATASRWRSHRTQRFVFKAAGLVSEPWKCLWDS